MSHPFRWLAIGGGVGAAVALITSKRAVDGAVVGVAATGLVLAIQGAPRLQT